MSDEYISFGDSINIYDMGFLYGFSLFETFLVNQKSSVFLLDEHIARLFDSMLFFKMDGCFTKEHLKNAVMQYIERNFLRDKVIRLTISYGNRQKNIKPAVIITQRDNPYCGPNAPSECKVSVSQCLKSEDSLLIRHKTSNYLENLLAIQDATMKGFDDVLFLNTKREITETAKCNIFFVKNGVLFTPSLCCGLLPGVLRKWIIDASYKLNISCREGCFTLNELLSADEIFITNSILGIMPVGKLDNTIFHAAGRESITRDLKKHLHLSGF